MKDLFSQFREHSGAIRVTPHQRAWDRIETKLEMRRSRRRLMQARYLSLAAVVFFLVTAFFAIRIYSSTYQGKSNTRYSHSLEDLGNVYAGSESIYDVSRIRTYHNEIR